MKIVFLLFSLTIAVGTAHAADTLGGHTYEEVLAAVDASNHPPTTRSLRNNDEEYHQRILNDVISENNPEPVGVEEEEQDFAGDIEEEGQVQGRTIGERCGRWAKCLDGLDCADSGVPLVKICLPMTCIESVVNNYNEANQDPTDGTTNLYEQYARRVLKGAHEINPNIPADGSIPDSDIFFNETTVGLGFDKAASRDNFMNILRSDVREAFETSLLQVQKEDPLDISSLHAKAQECFVPFMAETVLPPSHHHNGDDRGRNLQETTTLTLPGFFLELGGIFQFLYAFGVVSAEDVDNDEDIIVHDICIGGGPTAGASLGFLLQFWWIPLLDSTDNALTQALFPNRNRTAVAADTDSSSIDSRQAIFIPFPSIMIEIDAALGVGFGMAYNTFAFLCHRLWLKFHIGATGGLAFSVCFVGVDGGDLDGFGEEDTRRELM